MEGWIWVGEKGRRERDVSSSSACHLSPVSHLHQTSLVVELHNTNLLTIHCVYTHTYPSEYLFPAATEPVQW